MLRNKTKQNRQINKKTEPPPKKEKKNTKALPIG